MISNFLKLNSQYWRSMSTSFVPQAGYRQPSQIFSYLSVDNGVSAGLTHTFWNSGYPVQNPRDRKRSLTFFPVMVNNEIVAIRNTQARNLPLSLYFPSSSDLITFIRYPERYLQQMLVFHQEKNVGITCFRYDLWAFKAVHIALTTVYKLIVTKYNLFKTTSFLS